jgi:hypothetical protein
MPAKRRRLQKNTRISQEVIYEISSSSSSKNIPVDNSLETSIGEQGGFSVDDSHPTGGAKGTFATGKPQGSFVVGELGSSPPIVVGIGEVAWMMPLAVQRPTHCTLSFFHFIIFIRSS